MFISPQFSNLKRMPLSTHIEQHQLEHGMLMKSNCRILLAAGWYHHKQKAYGNGHAGLHWLPTISYVINTHLYGTVAALLISRVYHWFSLMGYRNISLTKCGFYFQTKSIERNKQKYDCTMCQLDVFWATLNRHFTPLLNHWPLQDVAVISIV